MSSKAICEAGAKPDEEEYQRIVRRDTEREMTRLRARVAELEARVQSAKQAGDLERRMEVVSPRGLPLVLSSGLPLRATLTIELYVKWYTLFLVHPDGSAGEVLYPDSPNYTEGEAPYVDHVPNPKVVARFARACKYDIDILAFELMVGRWEIEVRDNYTNPGDANCEAGAEREEKL